MLWIRICIYPYSFWPNFPQGYRTLLHHEIVDKRMFNKNFYGGLIKITERRRRPEFQKNGRNKSVVQFKPVFWIRIRMTLQPCWSAVNIFPIFGALNPWIRIRNEINQFKNWSRPLYRARTDLACPQKPNPSCETVPLKPGLAIKKPTQKNPSKKTH